MNCGTTPVAPSYPMRDAPREPGNHIPGPSRTKIAARSREAIGFGLEEIMEVRTDAMDIERARDQGEDGPGRWCSVWVCPGEAGPFRGRRCGRRVRRRFRECAGRSCGGYTAFRLEVGYQCPEPLDRKLANLAHHLGATRRQRCPSTDPSPQGAIGDRMLLRVRGLGQARPAPAASDGSALFVTEFCVLHAL